MSEELKQFYKEIQEWIEAECPAHPVFRPYYGLCWNLRHWADKHGKTVNVDILVFELAEQFVAARLDKEYPFNHGLDLEYNCECSINAIFQNQLRLAWIKEHAK